MMLADIAARAVALIQTTQPIAKQYFRQPNATDYKADNSPVTLADKAIEQLLREGINQLWPTHGIIGEEFPDKPANSPYTWVIDPIDGTKAFITGRATFCTLLALCQDSEPVIGIIYQPITEELWLGVHGQRTLFNGQPVPPLSLVPLAHARLATTAPEYFSEEELAIFTTLAKQCALTIYGGDAYNYGLLTLGHVDMVVEAGLKYHDIAALIPVVQGSDARIANWQGGKLVQNDGQVMAHFIKNMDAIL